MLCHHHNHWSSSYTQDQQRKKVRTEFFKETPQIKTEIHKTKHTGGEEVLEHLRYTVLREGWVRARDFAGWKNGKEAESNKPLVSVKTSRAQKKGFGAAQELLHQRFLQQRAEGRGRRDATALRAPPRAALPWDARSPPRARGQPGSHLRGTGRGSPGALPTMRQQGVVMNTFIYKYN